MYRNAEHYADPTAGAALAHIAHEERMARRKVAEARKRAEEKKKAAIEKQHRDKENNEKLKKAMGKVKGEMDPKAKAYDGKTYIWHYDGVSVAFRLQFVMKHMAQIYKAAGKEIPKDYLDKYEKLKKKIVPITDEEGKGIHGFQNGGVEIPGVGKIDHCFRTREDVTEALELLDYINSTDVRKLSGKGPYKATNGDYEKYDPSMISLAADNMIYFADFTSGNLLRLFAENPHYYEVADKMLSIPTEDMELAGKTKSELTKSGEQDAYRYQDADEQERTIQQCQ